MNPKHVFFFFFFSFFPLLSVDFQSMIMGLELKAVEGKISVGSDCSHHNLYS